MFLVSICRLGILESAVELRHLRYFVAVAEMENVSRAALKLMSRSQRLAGKSAISKTKLDFACSNARPSQFG
jgi:hypothetical protein